MVTPKTLPVRHSIRGINGDQARTEYYAHRRWRPAVSIAAAREYALSHGYAGIKVQLV